MNGLAATQVLRIWEHGLGRPAADRALVILAEAEPDAAFDELASLPIGERDGWLLAIREETFGSQFRVACGCAACGADLEFGFAASVLRHQDDSPDSRVPMSLEVDGLVLEVRLPDSNDLAAAAGCVDMASARQLLARRCIVSVPPGETAFDEMPETVIAGLAAYLENFDACGGTSFEVVCPACRARSDPIFDIAALLWTEIEAEAARLFRDVHRLARGYGWREAEILALTPLRRRVYLEMVPP